MKNPVTVTKSWFKKAMYENKLDPDQIYIVPEEESIEKLKQKVSMLTAALEEYADSDNWGRADKDDDVRALFYPLGFKLDNGWKHAKSILKKVKKL